MSRNRPATRCLRLLTLSVAGAASLSGCATVPAAGPTNGEIKRAVKRDNALGFSIVDVDPPLVERLNAARVNRKPLASMTREGRVDTLGPGDVLQIDVYEVGVSLFTGASPTGGTPGGFDPSARGTQLANVVINREGDLTLPYIGRLHVEGETPVTVERQIERAMAGMSQRPQAVVTVKQNLHNNFYVLGDVRAPGRYSLELPREKLLDALARAGGTVNQADDMVVRLTRDGISAETRLSEVETAGPQNVDLLPGDRVELFNRPRTYLAFGAITKVGQESFGQSSLSLAEAIARIAGPSEQTANPSAVYLFRYGDAQRDGSEKPVIYRLDMRRPQSYFLSQRFAMQDKDVIYIAGADINAPAKVTQVLGQFLTPFITARVLTR